MRYEREQTTVIRGSGMLRRAGWLVGGYFIALTVVLGVTSSVADAQTDSYARYTHPGQCVQLASRLDQLYWRDRRRDTVMYRPLTDSAPTTALLAATACARRFDVATTAVRDLPNLVQLYLWIGQDSLADVAATRLLRTPRQLLAEQAGWDEEGWLLQMLVESALGVRPVRLPLAERYLHMLDTIRAASAAPWRMRAHSAMAQYALSVGNLIKARDAANAALQASQAMVRSEQIDRAYEMVGPYNLLAEPASILVNGPTAVALFDSARARLSPLRAPGVGKKDLSNDPSAVDMMRQVFSFEGTGSEMARPESSELERLQGYIALLRMPYTLVSLPAPSITATRWAPNPTDTAARPRQGIVTLVIAANANCGGGCYSKYAVLRRLHATYASRGLQIVMLASTQGYFRNQPQPSPSGEAELARNYILEFLKLPGVLGIEETKFSFRADGMRMDAPGETLRDYFRGRDAAVVGADGVIRQVVNLEVWREQMVHDVIAAAFGGAGDVVGKR